MTVEQFTVFLSFLIFTTNCDRVFKSSDRESSEHTHMCKCVCVYINTTPFDMCDFDRIRNVKKKLAPERAHLTQSFWILFLDFEFFRLKN